MVLAVGSLSHVYVKEPLVEYTVDLNKRAPVRQHPQGIVTKYVGSRHAHIVLPRLFGKSWSVAEFVDREEEFPWADKIVYQAAANDNRDDVPDKYCGFSDVSKVVDWKSVKDDQVTLAHPAHHSGFWEVWLDDQLVARERTHGVKSEKVVPFALAKDKQMFKKCSQKGYCWLRFIYYGNLIQTYSNCIKIGDPSKADRKMQYPYGQAYMEYKKFLDGEHRDLQDNRMKKLSLPSQLGIDKKPANDYSEGDDDEECPCK